MRELASMIYVFSGNMRRMYQGENTDTIKYDQPTLGTDLILLCLEGADSIVVKIL